MTGDTFQPGDRVIGTTSRQGIVLATHERFVWALMDGSEVPSTFTPDLLRHLEEER